MSKFLTSCLSLFPILFLEWILKLCAWLQLHILSAKGILVKAEIQQEGNKPRRKKKNKSHRRRKSESSLLELNRSLVREPGENSSDPPAESVLFEANEQHRREFEGFMRNVKDIKDVHNWLKNFSKEAPRKIAIVKLSRRILETDYGIALASSALAFMFKFGLYPIVIHGGFNELTRDTCSEVIARRREYSLRLKEAIRRNGVGAAILPSDICLVEPVVGVSGHYDSDGSSSGSDGASVRMSGGQGYVCAVGQDESSGGVISGGGGGGGGGLSLVVRDIDHSRLVEPLERGKIPIWDGVARTMLHDVEIPLNSDVTTVEIARLVQPFRIIFACNDGGILDKDHKAIPVVYMDKDYDELIEADWVSNRRKIQLHQLKRIVEVVPSSTTVVVTSIDSVTHQLMYPRLFSETIVKRGQDNVVQVIEDMSLIEWEKLRDLIEDSFGRPLAGDYFDYLKKCLHRMYLCTSADGEYNGCAIVTKGDRQFYYLCKFCVRKAAQGLGLGDLLWRFLQRDIERMYWRSRSNNPLNTWYFQRCQGSFRTNDQFTVFWYGDDRYEDGCSLILDAIRRPVTVLPLPPVGENA